MTETGLREKGILGSKHARRLEMVTENALPEER